MQDTLERIRSTDPRSKQFVDQMCELLKAKGLLDEAAVMRARRAQQQSGERFDLVLMRLGLLPDAGVARLLAEYCGMPLHGEAEFPAEPLLPDVLRHTFLKTNHMLPIRETEEAVYFAVADPFNADALAAVAFLLGRRIAYGIASEGEIDRAIAKLYAHEAPAPQGLERQGEGDADEQSSDDDIQRLEDMASEAPVIKLVRDLIVKAVEAKASDIHIEPREDSLQVRYRIDGVLRTVESFPVSARAAIGSRIKIMARLNIAERRLPQDGRIKESVRGHEVDLRVSTMPTMWGESIVLRILDRSSIELDFPKLGFGGPSLSAFDRLLAEPNGIILVTGPTGSGKTTTLYTALRQLNKAEAKIFTVEDPIEYHLAGINQIQVQPKIGLTFAHALRSILRQDPDIIMVGEIRDLETAQIAIQASLTGHLVLSTVHTNSAAATVTRLLDMGVEKYLLASCLKGVLAQRLVRRLCPTCAQPTEMSVSLKGLCNTAGMAVDGQGTARPRHAVGCEACRRVGYSGRTTVYELLTMTEAVRQSMMTTNSDVEIERAAVKDGMQTMLQNGLEKVLRGETSPEEVMRVTRFDTCQDMSTKPTTSTEH